MANILVADDEPKLGKLVAEMLEVDGHTVTRVTGGKAALGMLDSARYDLVLTDLRMPEVDGLTVLKVARARAIPPEVVMMTAFASAESAVEAMREGAADYLIKPFAMDELRLRVRRLLNARGAEQSRAQLLERMTPGLVAESPGMQAALEAARKVASTDASVLLLGESGTGKSQLARFLHYASKRASGPLAEVHCAALPETLLESELFGHEKGAFTGAQQRKVGHLAAATGGTLFLDEIGEITQATQVKLLRFLQDRSFTPLGSTEARKVDVRVVAATNRELSEAVKAGTFREDFYYRLNVFTIEVPPLRARREDILAIAANVLATKGIPAVKLSEAARKRLVDHDWPGNVRELENALERAVILSADGEILPDHLGLGAAPGQRAKADQLLVPGFNLDAHERDLIYAALERAGGNKTHAAKLLGITRRRLYSQLDSIKRGEPAAPEGADPDEGAAD
jgi:DNA-binding NtrC family response regulator